MRQEVNDNKLNLYEFSKKKNSLSKGNSTESNEKAYPIFDFKCMFII
jgi:hypothetical protein